MSLYGNPEGMVGYNELSPYVQSLLSGASIDAGIYIDRSYFILTQYNDRVTVNLNTFNPATDELLVFKNGLFMTLGYEYQFNNTDKTISPLNGETWDGSETKPIIFDFIGLEKTTGGGGDSGGGFDFVKIKIKESEWIQENDMYYKIVTHNLDSTSLILSAVNSDTKKSLQEIYTIIDENTLKLYNDSKINLSLTIIDVDSVKPGGSSSSKTLNVSNFTFDNELNMYKATVNHNLDGEDLLIGAIDSSTKNSVHIAYDVVDSNSIILYNTDSITLKLSILSIK